MADLPLDILINHIFMKLPVKSLLRSRCVCKQWLKLLTRPEFIKMHVEDQFHNHKKFLFGPIYCNKVPCRRIEDSNGKVEDSNGIFYSVDLKSADTVRLPGFPLKGYHMTIMFGYCNGMIYMEIWNNNANYVMNRFLFFGNPSTGFYKILPDPIAPPPSLIVGFGYDSSIDDYNFVRVDSITRNPHIFSLKSNSWRTILGSSDNYSIQLNEGCSNNVGLALDGSIYWLVERSNIIVGFDLKDNEFIVLPVGA